MNEREQLNIQEQRYKIFERDNFVCKVCGESIYINNTPQLAHRICQSKSNIKKYGKEIIHHSLNMWSTCGLQCNSSAMLHGPIARETLIDEIMEAIDARK